MTILSFSSTAHQRTVRLIQCNCIQQRNGPQQQELNSTDYTIFRKSYGSVSMSCKSTILKNIMQRLVELWQSSITSSPFNVFAVLALHASLLLLAPSVMLHLVSGISSLCLFVNLILVPVLPFPTHLFLHPSLLPLLIHHSVHP